jgi:hypothetical protein
MRLTAALVFALATSIMPMTHAAAATIRSCPTGFSHIRAGKMTMKYDANHNGWLCSKTTHAGSKTTHAYQDDKKM